MGGFDKWVTARVTPTGIHLSNRGRGKPCPYNDNIRIHIFANKFLQPFMKNFNQYINLIHHEFPGFIISSINKAGEGDDSKAFFINEKYIFRFPKSKRVKIQTQREIAVLPRIKSSLNLQIPQFEFVSPKINFVGYKIIHGTPLTFEMYNSLNKKQQVSIQQSIGNFLYQLHHTDLQTLRDCGLELMDPRQEYSDNFIEAKKTIYPHISKSRQKIITQLFTKYLDNSKNFKYTPALIHNDFSKDHILFNDETRLINGIIDFGDIAIGDPDYDLMYLLDEFGEGFLNGIFKIYKQKNKKELMRKLYFFSFANKIQIILGYINEKESDELKDKYKVLDGWFKKYSTKEIIIR